MSPKEPAVWPPEGYVPIVTRTPAALEDERVERERVAFEARIAAVMADLGVTRTEARKIIAGS
jgi:hypothetical protein